MSSKPIVLDPDIKRLLDEGYEVEVQNGYLLVHAVPYVTASKTVALGTVVTDLAMNAQELLPPRDHQVWWQGEYPCRNSGTPIDGIRNVSEPRMLWDGFQVQHRFSNKPEGGNFPDYFSKMTSYIRIIANEAKAIDPNATPCTFNIIPPVEEASVFRYHDSASSRADILALSMKLAMKKVAIVGMGGTGSYVLDLIAKTPIQEIHLFDGDVFLQHNAFRSPGAASREALSAKSPKANYYAELYGAMRSGLVPHAEYLTVENVGVLTDFDFVFLCVDNGQARKVISDHLIAEQIPFVDVGMDMLMVPGAGTLIGTCRVTTCTPGRASHFPRHAPMADDLEDDLYRKNIQVADMNALNAALAVIRWKQFCGFYQDLVQAHQTTFSINAHSLTRDEMIDGLGA